MATQYAYQQTIENKYLGKIKTIKAASSYELDVKVNEQLKKWRAEADKVRTREVIAMTKERAEELSKEDDKYIQSINSILKSATSINVKKEWSKLKDQRSFGEFIFKNYLTKPQEPADRSASEPIFQHVFLSSLRISAEERARKEWQEKHDAWEFTVRKEKEDYLRKLEEYQEALNKERAKQEAAYNEEKTEFEKQQKEYNDSLDRELCTSIVKDPKTVAAYYECLMDMLSNSLVENPDIKVSCSANEHIVEFSLSLQSSDNVRNVAAHKYVASTKSIKEVPLKKTEFNSLYDSYVFQSALGVLAIATNGYQESHCVDSFVVNVYVSGIDKTNGRPFNSCILSMLVPVSEAREIDFSLVDAKECIRSLKGLYAGTLTSLAPVNPIVKLDTNDKRFIESRDVIESLDPTQNLAIMDWQDFEYLVRELFGRIFGGDGGEVKITQASRDQGVDAVAFDPDPIRGGKFVIQAKRYNNVVGVSAVRDLYGTMMNEHAARGLLVTTSYFGADSRDFVKDKPIQLIDGQNLLALLKQYGYGDYNITLGTERVAN